MIRAIALIATLPLLLGCAPDANYIQLADVDLDDARTVQEIRSWLNAEEGAAFANYLVKHRIASSAFCGKTLIGPRGKPPGTVGEAIELTLAQDARDQRARAMAVKSRPSWERQQELNHLTERRDLLADMQSMLRAEHGSAAERLPQWSSIETSLAEVNKRLVALRLKVSRPQESAS